MAEIKQHYTHTHIIINLNDFHLFIYLFLYNILYTRIF